MKLYTIWEFLIYFIKFVPLKVLKQMKCTYFFAPTFHYKRQICMINVFTFSETKFNLNNE